MVGAFTKLSVNIEAGSKKLAEQNIDRQLTLK
jgi:hypothetical protein